MRLKKLPLVVFMVLSFIIVLINYVFAQSMEVEPSELNYNRFLVADLGLLGSGKANEIFRVSFDSSSEVKDNYYLKIEVTRLSDGKILLSGNTQPKPYNKYFSGQEYTNYNITDADVPGGDFTLSEEAGDLTDMVMATGALPEGGFRVKLELYKQGDTLTNISHEITINITPPYIQPIYPVNISVTSSSLNFRWRSNMNNMSLHLYTDPAGRNEITSGARLPARGVGQGLDGSLISSILHTGEHYFWQIQGDIETSHGKERVKGPLSEFLYLQEGSQPVFLGLSEAEKEAIRAEIYDILFKLINRRAARSILDYDIDRVLFDGSPVSMMEIMAVLDLIKENKITVNAIYFR